MLSRPWERQAVSLPSHFFAADIYISPFACRRARLFQAQSFVLLVVSTGINAKPEQSSSTKNSEKDSEMILKKVAQSLKEKADITNLLARVSSQDSNGYLHIFVIITHIHTR